MKKGIISIISALLGGIVGAGVVGKSMMEKENSIQIMSDKHFSLFLMMNQWVKVKQERKSLVEYFKKEGYKNIAIYGMSYAGETLLEELKDTDIHVVYGIDKGAESIYAEIDIVSPDDNLQEVDVIVVTAITFFEDIEEKLSKKVNCPIVSLEDVLYEL
jgi:hypothetical protein